jgi:hypothetical protein
MYSSYETCVVAYQFALILQDISQAIYAISKRC